MAENNQAKYTYGVFIFICSVEKYLTADGKLPLADCWIVKSNSKKALTDLEGQNRTKMWKIYFFHKNRVLIGI